jgi:hypothetical protein
MHHFVLLFEDEMLGDILNQKIDLLSKWQMMLPALSSETKTVITGEIKDLSQIK